MDLQKAYCGSFKVWGKEDKDAKFKFAARVIAESMSRTKIEVKASSDIGGDFPTGAGLVFAHGECFHTNTEALHNLVEDARVTCGRHAIVLMYDYDKPPFAIIGTGNIRMVEPNGEHYLKPYGPQGTFAFRFDSLLSHLSIMRGYRTETARYPYPLPPGRILPAQNPDEAVRGGVYFYGSLNQCPKEGRGKWIPCNYADMSQRLHAVKYPILAAFSETAVIATTAAKCATFDISIAARELPKLVWALVGKFGWWITRGVVGCVSHSCNFHSEWCRVYSRLVRTNASRRMQIWIKRLMDSPR